MNSLIKGVNRYKVFIVLVLINLIIFIINPDLGNKSAKITWSNTKVMVSIIPPVFILFGLLDVWVKRETMVKYLGEGSGFKGVILALFLGSAAAGPLYAAFPVAIILLKKGSRLFNVLIMLGAWSTTKIPLLLFELSVMGLKFTIIRLFLNLFGIIVIAYFTERILSKTEKQEIYNIAFNQK